LQAILLAAGQSKRFYPLEDKNFFKFGKNFLIERQIETLQKAGIKKIIIVANKNNFKKISTLSRGLSPKLTTEIVIQKNPAEGMRGGVLSAKKFLNKPSLITSTNDLVSASVIKKVLSVKSCNGSILAQKVEKYFPGGYLEIKKGKISSIIEKPVVGKEPSSLVNIVFHFFTRPQDLVKELEKNSNKNDDGYEQALNKLFPKQKFKAVQNNSEWIALKFPWHVLDLMKFFLKTQKRSISKNAEIAKTAIIEGNVVIEDGVKIFDYAIVKNAWIGKNAIVGNHSLVRDSHIAENAVVGSGSEVARSYIGENSWLHRNYVGDSIFAGNVSLGSGCVCANLRLDEKEIGCEINSSNFWKKKNKKISTQRNKFGCVIGKNSRIGVNTSLMPGILIGENSFVGSGLVVEKNVTSQHFFTAMWKTKSIQNKKTVVARAKPK